MVGNEVQFTELFRNLCSYKIFRSILSEWISCTFPERTNLDTSKLSFNSDEIQSQVSMYSVENSDAHRSRPDLRINNRKREIMLELKVDPYCELTDNQPESYLSLLYEG